MEQARVEAMAYDPEKAAMDLAVDLNHLAVTYDPGKDLFSVSHQYTQRHPLRAELYDRPSNWYKGCQKSRKEQRARGGDTNPPQGRPQVREME